MVNRCAYLCRVISFFGDLLRLIFKNTLPLSKCFTAGCPMSSTSSKYVYLQNDQADKASCGGASNVFWFVGCGERLFRRTMAAPLLMILFWVGLTSASQAKDTRCEVILRIEGMT